MVRSATGMAPSRMTDLDVHAIWKRMEARRHSVRLAKVKIRVGQHVRISKFTNGAKQNFSTEIFRITKVMERRPQTLYEMKDLNGVHMDGQFYQE